jgi:NADPH2:quinone reductase
VREATGGRGADVIYDSVGGDTFDRSLKCIAWNGRLLVIGFASGRIPEVRANRILLKNISLIGLNWGGLQLREPAHAKRAQAELERLHGEGRIDPVIYATFPLDQTPAALEAISSRRSHGKVIVHPRR